MATLLKTWSTYYRISGTGSPSSYVFDVYGQIAVYLESQDFAANTSLIRIDHKTVVWRSSSASTSHYAVINNVSSYRANNGSPGGSYQSKSHNITRYGAAVTDTYTVSAGSTYHTIYHNPDGSAQLYVNGSATLAITIYFPGGNNVFGPLAKGSSFNTPLSTIPRVPSYNSISSSNVTFDSVYLSANINTQGLGITDGGWDISTDGGLTWSYHAGGPTGAIISGLNPGTQYWYRGYVATDGGGANSGWGNFTTIALATISNNSVDFDVDTGITIIFTNPSGASVDLYIESPNESTRITRENITSPYTLSLDNDEKNILFGLSPNSNALAVRFRLRTNDNDSYNKYKSGNALISNANPTFSNFLYEDVNIDTINLTGNNQVIIAGHSNVKAIVPVVNKATANKGANMTREGYAGYRFVVGTKQDPAIGIKAWSDTTNVEMIINSVLNNMFNVFAIDSRTNSTLKIISPSSYINYSKPTSTGPGEAKRTNDTEAETTLEFIGKFFSYNFGEEVNALTVVYEYKKRNDSVYTTGSTPITPAIGIPDANNIAEFSFSGLIAGDLGASGFNTASAYDIHVIVSDKLDSVEYNILLDAAQPNIDLYRDAEIAGMAINDIYDETLGGALQINGPAYINKKIILEYDVVDTW
jgi:hypothetical protein